MTCTLLNLYSIYRALALTCEVMAWSLVSSIVVKQIYNAPAGIDGKGGACT